MYRQLDPGKIVATVQKLRNRIQERFPEAGLSRVAEELLVVASASAERSRRLGRPYLLLRLGAALVTAAVLGLIGATLYSMDLKAEVLTMTELVQALESGINDLIFLAVAIFFLFTAEGRLRRSHALKAVHELRVLAHIVDMHQLTKDPDRVLHAGVDTASSPKRSMSRFELARYLDYCSEMLSLISKLAALYVQHLQDPVVLEAVDAIEDLTNGLSRKVWQKIMILDTIGAAD
jgi:hypothetical protein